MAISEFFPNPSLDSRPGWMDGSYLHPGAATLCFPSFVPLPPSAGDVVTFPGDNARVFLSRQALSALSLISLGLGLIDFFLVWDQ